MFPRYFLSANPVDVGNTPLSALLDLFWLSPPGGQAELVMVAVDLQGHLRLLPAQPIHAQGLEAELAQLELLVKPRTIIARELWLFSLQGIEAATHVHGLNDPVNAQGHLLGPFPQAAMPLCATGQLCVTRADILDGVQLGFPWGIPVQTAEGPSRCLHLPLPGESTEHIQAGRGVILAYPMLPAELSPADRANEGMVLDLLYLVLSGIQGDMQSERIAHPLAQEVLPVPDRAALIADWAAEGFVVEGAEAIRRPKGRGFLGSLASALAKPERRIVPEQAHLQELMAQATLACKALPDWPDARSQALRSRIAKFSLAPPRAPPESEFQPPPAPVYRRAHSSQPEWQSDFEAPQTPINTAPPPRNKPPAQKPPSKGKRPAWMDDFE